MKKLLQIIIFSVWSVPLLGQSDGEMLKRIYNEILANGQAYEQLRFLTQEIGNRLTGSPGAAAAVDWSKETMEQLGFDSVYLQEVMVPNWKRGNRANGRILNSERFGGIELDIIALGNTVGTGPDGVTGNIIEVKNFVDLLKIGEDKIKGNIVFFNRRMDPTSVNTFAAYGMAGDQRRAGPGEAAKFGASGVIVRSLTPNIDDHPHTGATRYLDDVPKIPAVAISTKDADRLSVLLNQEPDLKVHFQTNAQMLGEKLSYNVIGELTGSDFPNEYIAVGGHLDSWDVGEGAHDDGAGCVQSIEVLRALKAIGYQPKRTIRAVMFMNEENGLRGGREYARMAEQNNEKHIAAMESDRGGFTPRGFTLDMDERTLRRVQAWKSLFEPFGIYVFEPGGGGADIGPLKSQNVPLIGFKPDDQRYFKYHHTDIDTFDKVDERELHMGAATMAALIYLIDKNGL
ncbi:MAG: M20/M25/M40 family metallo-hydrolase [Cyclobacteriaceae bacterium]